MIPSDDEDVGIVNRCSSHASSGSGLASRDARVVEKLASGDESIPSKAAVTAATWRAFHRPRMALAVLAVSLQHIAAHSDHLQYGIRHHCPGVVESIANHPADANASRHDHTTSTKETTAITPIQQEPAEVADDQRHKSSLDEGIESDRRLPTDNKNRVYHIDTQ